MEQALRAFEPYRHFDPLGWIGLFRFVPVWAGVLAVVVGVLMLFFGAGRMFRLVAAPLGFAIGLVWAGAVAERLGYGSLQQKISIIAAIALFSLGLLLPPGVVFFAFGVPSGLLAGQLAGHSDWLIGFVPGFMVGGVVGVLVHRPTAGALSSAFGAWALVLGAMAALAPFIGVIEFFANNPIITLSLMGCIALAGTVYQVFVRPSPEKLDEQKREKQMKKKSDKERKDLEERWSNYSKNAKKGKED